MFSSRREDRQQVEELEDEAELVAAQLGEVAVVEAGDLGAVERRPSPTVGRSRPARMCISVDLPEPDGPMIALKRPRSKETDTPASASTAASPSP